MSKYETDIPIILENDHSYCNILVGKAPFWRIANQFCQFLLCEIEIKRGGGKKYIADCTNKEIKARIRNLIIDRFNSIKPVYPFEIILVMKILS
jgi:hypothetical protein